MHAALLNANTSGECLEISPARFDGEYFHCVVSARIRIWESTLIENWITIKADTVPLSLPSMFELRERLNEWLDTPSVGLAAFTGHFRLTTAPSSTFDLHFEPRADTIASADKPVVTVDLFFGTTRIGFRFVTDQSCLSLFAGAISNWKTEQ